MTPCNVCATPTIKRCSRCSAFALCSPECMKTAWPKHKSDCKNIVASRKAQQDAGLALRDEKTIPCQLTAEDFLALNALAMGVYEKHDIYDLPMKGSTMDSKKKIDMFLDFLDVHDSSSEKQAEAPLPAKLFLNRRFNNAIKHAEEHFTANEFRQLLKQVKDRRIGAANK